MSWNYRVMTCDNGLTYEIYEVYYHYNGSLKMYTENSIKPFGESLEDLKDELNMMIKAFENPVLKPEDFPTNEK